MGGERSTLLIRLGVMSRRSYEAATQRPNAVPLACGVMVYMEKRPTSIGSPIDPSRHDQSNDLMGAGADMKSDELERAERSVASV